MAIINEIDVVVSELILSGNPPSSWDVTFAVTARNGEQFIVQTDQVSTDQAGTPEEAIDEARSLLETGIVDKALALESQSSSLVGTVFQIPMPAPFEVEDEAEPDEEGESEVE